MNKSVSNVYLNKIAAKSFENATKIPTDNFHDIASFILKHIPENNYLNILDLGSGTGRSVLNILKYFDKKEIPFYADCIEVSDYMIEEFEKNKKNINFNSNVNLIKHDLNKGIQFDKSFDVIMIISVLQYIDNWRIFLNNLFHKLNKEGIIVFAELIGWFRLLDGNFDKESKAHSEELSFNFWREYFSKRNLYGNWNPEISFSKVQPIINHFNKSLKLTEKKDFFWTNVINWEEVLSWIYKGPVSSLGSNIINESGKNELKNHMREFLIQNNIDLQKKFTIKWGFRIYVFQQ